MKTNTRPNQMQLVLSFSALTGVARQMLSAQVQLALFALGYRWAGQEKSEPQLTTATNLFICSPDWSALDITWSGNDRMVSDDTQQVFDAAHNLEGFLKEAKAALTHRTVINGVYVVVTPNTVQLDPSKLLRDVAQDASAIQKALWG